MGETMLSIFRTGLVGVIPKLTMGCCITGGLTIGNVGIESVCGICGN
jgi:hypothetical protein